MDSENSEEDGKPAIALRTLNMEDLKQADNQVSLCFCCILEIFILSISAF